MLSRKDKIMEIPSAPPVPSMAPGGATASNNSVNSNNTAAIGQVPDQVVTSATQSSGSSVREDDANRQAPDEQRNRMIQNYANDNKSNLVATLSIDPINSQVFVDIKAGDTGDTIVRFPSEELKTYLSAKQSESGASDVNFKSSI